jgi:Na+/phosphate symporter
VNPGLTLVRMLISWAVLLIALAGVLLLALSSNAKVVQIGTIMFLCGLLATCLLLAGKSVRIG